MKSSLRSSDSGQCRASVNRAGLKQKLVSAKCSADSRREEVSDVYERYGAGRGSLAGCSEAVSSDCNAREALSEGADGLCPPDCTPTLLRHPLAAYGEDTRSRVYSCAVLSLLLRSIWEGTSRTPMQQESYAYRELYRTIGCAADRTHSAHASIAASLRRK